MNTFGDNQVVYLTGTYGNIVDYTSGKKIWKKNIEFDKDRPVLYAIDEATNTFMVYNDKKVFKFDTKTTDAPKPLAKLKKVKNEESIADIGLFDWGISLAGEGDVIGVGLDGTIKYQNAYVEPGNRKLLKGLGTAATVGLAGTYAVAGSKAATGASIAMFTSRAPDGHIASDKEINKNMAIANAAASGAELSSALTAKVASRFQALKTNKDYAFVLAKGASGPELVKVKKADGTEVDKISIDNNKPIYEVDSFNGNIYYVFKNELRTYSGK
ncbi:hypothetical protein FACS1894195_5040 [Bacteroidia bacterium]|nr:hypothetical protein FACS1894195_5040 [Bacteroidia bacterium]